MALGNKYENYEKSLLILNLETLEQRRWNLSLKFAQQSIKNKTMEEYFKLKISQNNLTLSRPGVQPTHYYWGGPYGPPPLACNLWGSRKKFRSIS